MVKPAVLVLVLSLALAVSALTVETAGRARKQARTAQKMLATAEMESALGMLRDAAERGVLSASASHAAAARLMAEFEGYEHRFGMQQLRFDIGVDTPEVVSTSDRALVTEDGVAIAMDDLVAISGDYFGVKDAVSAIMCNDPAHGRPESGQAARFWKAFNDLWKNPTYGASAPAKFRGQMGTLFEQIRGHFNDEKVALEKEKGPTRGSDAYNKGGGGMIQYVKDLVAALSPSIKGKGRSEGSFRALAYNDDHFNWCAENTHRFGMTQAVNMAHAAGVRAKSLATTPAASRAALKASIKTDLIKAYGVAGFVSHQLSDLFSAGHVRTPRVELRDICLSSLKQAPAAGITANVQHDEDNINCLLCKNLRSQVWWVCGDRRYFDDVNANNRAVQHLALDAANQQVRKAFEAGRAGQPNPAAAPGFTPDSLSLIPRLVSLSQRESLENTCPLVKVFTASNGKRMLMARTGINEANGMPRPPIARRTDFGSSLQTTASNVIFPTFKPLPALSPIPADAKPAEMDCQYKEFKIEMCCSVPYRSTPQPAAETNPAARGKRNTWVNACKITQSVLGAANSLANTAANMRDNANAQGGIRGAVTNAGATVVDATADVLVGVHHVVDNVVKKPVARVVAAVGELKNRNK